MQDFEKSVEGRKLPVPRKDMLAADTTEAGWHISKNT